uniref:Uncharacterized protein n=1 Tax=Arundo donax TaxID=35708 RepID=A0A0A9HCZ8_ARUDO
MTSKNKISLQKYSAKHMIKISVDVDPCEQKKSICFDRHLSNIFHALKRKNKVLRGTSYLRKQNVEK